MSKRKFYYQGAKYIFIFLIVVSADMASCGSTLLVRVENYIAITRGKQLFEQEKRAR